MTGAARDLQAEQDHAEWHGWMDAQGYDFADDSYQAEAFAAGMQAERNLAATPAQRDPVHLMTIEMGAWCGAAGPGNGRASSAWREVTCTECLAKGAAWLRALAWDMLQAMPASHAALSFAVRAGRLGVTDEQGRPLAMACTTEADL